ncbi:hypothetical protein [Xenorhabdus entomophaga]|uniref:hypothetical protein n=1 Tax=Xenorhabdus entomophaga TaxID=3136257 RepID=UPI0030F3EEB0
MKNSEQITLSPPKFTQAYGTNTINIHDVNEMGNKYLLMEVPRYDHEEIGDEIFGLLCLNGDCSSSNNAGVIKSLPYTITPDKEKESPYYLLFLVDEISLYGTYQAQYKIISHGNERNSPTVNINLITSISKHTPAIAISLPKETKFLNNQMVFVMVEAINIYPKDAYNISSFKIVPDDGQDTIIVTPASKFNNYNTTGIPIVNQGFFLTIVNKNTKTNAKFTVSALNKSGATASTLQPLTVTHDILPLVPNQLIKLETENEFIELPETENLITDKNSKYSSYVGRLTTSNGAGIPNVQIYIASQQDKQLSTPLINITTEPGAGNTGDKYDIHQLEGKDFFSIITDPQGFIKFRAYPIKYTSVRVDFLTGIPEINPFYFASSIYVFKTNTMFPELAFPSVVGIQENGKIVKIPRDDKFSVNIDSYEGINNMDRLVFFVGKNPQNTKQLLPIYTVQDTNTIKNRNFNFSYDQLEPNQGLGLSFMAIPQIGNPKYSFPLYINYFQDENNPDDNKDKVYDKVIVYSTTTPPKPSDTEGIIHESSAITFNTISKNIELNGSINNGKTGLYVIIKLAASQNEKNLPKYGKKGYLRVSATGKKDKTIDFILDESNVLTDGQEKYINIPIPFCDLIWIGLSEDITSQLYIDYTITDSDSGKLEKSKIWVTDIDTVILGDSPDINYGCIS